MSLVLCSLCVLTGTISSICASGSGNFLCMIVQFQRGAVVYTPTLFPSHSVHSHKIRTPHSCALGCRHVVVWCGFIALLSFTVVFPHPVDA